MGAVSPVYCLTKCTNKLVHLWGEPEQERCKVIGVILNTCSTTDCQNKLTTERLATVTYIQVGVCVSSTMNYYSASGHIHRRRKIIKCLPHQ